MPIGFAAARYGVGQVPRERDSEWCSSTLATAERRDLRHARRALRSALWGCGKGDDERSLFLFGLLFDGQFPVGRGDEPPEQPHLESAGVFDWRLADLPGRLDVCLREHLTVVDERDCHCVAIGPDPDRQPTDAVAGEPPQEFAEHVRREVEAHDTRLVMLDGVAGYRLTLQGSTPPMLTHLHALGRYLKRQGVTGIFVDETAEITGSFNATQDNISYLADSIVFLRHIELRGELRKAIGVLKKRTGDYERTLREFEITPDGLRVGEPLTKLRGVLTGTPETLE